MLCSFCPNVTRTERSHAVTVSIENTIGGRMNPELDTRLADLRASVRAAKARSSELERRCIVYPEWNEHLRGVLTGLARKDPAVSQLNRPVPVQSPSPDQPTRYRLLDPPRVPDGPFPLDSLGTDSSGDPMTSESPVRTLFQKYPEVWQVFMHPADFPENYVTDQERLRNQFPNPP
jgi:hypothetical protein